MIKLFQTILHTCSKHYFLCIVNISEMLGISLIALALLNGHNVMVTISTPSNKWLSFLTKSFAFGLSACDNACLSM